MTTASLVQPTHSKPVRDQDTGLLIDRPRPAAAPSTPEEAQLALQARSVGIDRLFEEAQVAKYKIEMAFHTRRSVHRPTPGMMSFFESGRKLHGGGDVKVYLCPGSVQLRDGSYLGKGECNTIIADDHHRGGVAVCGRCGTAWPNPLLFGELLANWSMARWAEMTAFYVGVLGGSCDILLKYSPDDIRTVTQKEQARNRGGELLERTRDRYWAGTAIYRLRSIIRDTSGGQDLAAQFKKFYLA